MPHVCMVAETSLQAKTQDQMQGRQSYANLTTIQIAWLYLNAQYALQLQFSNPNYIKLISCTTARQVVYTCCM
jgi:hypothetical protein